jgi:hypothetical protein
MTQGSDETEDRKRYMAVLLEGPPVVCLDNLTRPLGGAALCTILTQEDFHDRILGVSQTARVKTN